MSGILLMVGEGGVDGLGFFFFFLVLMVDNGSFSKFVVFLEQKE